MSTAFLRTLREDPAGAEVPSHRLLVRAGYLRRAGAGSYSLLPLGKLVLDNIARIVRAELATIGAQEVLLPALLPAAVYQASGRWSEYGEEMFKLRDRRGAQHLLAPTHEEAFTLLVKDLCTSYRDLPVILYQIQTKFRDEPRPRGGLLRCREFLMKDSYSFDLDDEGLAASYAAHRDAYQRIFSRVGLSVTIVAATAGAMGGSASEEFLAAADVGEDTYAVCGACGYAANTEAVRDAGAVVRDDVDTVRDAGTPAAPHERRAAHGSTSPAAGTVHGSTSPAAGMVHGSTGPAGGRAPMAVLDTPDTPTIASLVERLNAVRAGGRDAWSAAQTLKNVVVTIAGGHDRELAVVGVPGDREVDLKRLNAALYPAVADLAGPEHLAAYPDLVPGYIGPQILAKLGIRYLADPRVAPGTAWVTGANEPGRHAIDVVCGRDFTVSQTLDVREVRTGDPCPDCGGPLAIRSGIEVGHIFQLGRRYADAFALDVAGPQGTPTRVTMGSYGIGLSRVMAAIAEQHHDERGLSWPAGVAPCDVHIVPTSTGEPLEVAEATAAALVAAGHRVLLDDRRGVSAGVKFADGELIGVPHVVVVGRRAADGYGELRVRATGERAEVPLRDLATLLPNPTL